MNTSEAAPEKVLALGVSRMDGMAYFVADGSLWRVAGDVDDLVEDGADLSQRVRVAELSIIQDPRYTYFLDDEGDISRQAIVDAFPRPGEEPTRVAEARTSRALQFWIVKGNRRMNDLDADLHPGLLQTWITKKPPALLSVGDRVFMWKSSPDLILTGLAEVTSLPGWNAESFFEFRLRFLTTPFEKPLAQSDLRGDAELRGASFLKAGPAGTVFQLTPAQAQRLLERIETENPGLAVTGEWLLDLGAAPPVTPQSGLAAAGGSREQPGIDALLPGPNVIPGKGIRTLTVRQPWAWAIVHGHKDVENRSRPTNIRGTIAIHAGAAAPTDDEIAEFRTASGLNPPAALPLGRVLGTVDIISCVDDSSSTWADDGQWHWVLANPRLLAEPKPAKGALGFWYWKM